MRTSKKKEGAMNVIATSFGAVGSYKLEIFWKRGMPHDRAKDFARLLKDQGWQYIKIIRYTELTYGVVYCAEPLTTMQLLFTEALNGPLFTGQRLTASQSWPKEPE